VSAWGKRREVMDLSQKKCPKCGGPLSQDGSEIYCANLRSLAIEQEELKEALDGRDIKDVDLDDEDEWAVKMYLESIARRTEHGPVGACDFEVIVCPNDGTCVAIIDLGPKESEHMGFYCGCNQEYVEVENAATEEAERQANEKFPKNFVSILYHPTWWEALGYSENPMEQDKVEPCTKP
jgi:hypothetical protein